MNVDGRPVRVRVDGETEVAVGQVWEDLDPRSRRTLVIEGLAGSLAITRTLRDGVLARRAQIRLDRFPRSYRMLADMPPEMAEEKARHPQEPSTPENPS